MTVTTDQIIDAYKCLDFERARGDELQEDLAESALNDLLDRFNRQPSSQSHLSHVTTERGAT